MELEHKTITDENVSYITSYSEIHCYFLPGPGKPNTSDQLGAALFEAFQQP